jgi:hypothetical protein
MVGIRKAYRHYYMTGLDIEFRHKGLLNPKLFKLNFSALFNVLFPFSAFTVFLFLRDSRTGMLKFYFRRHCPSFAKIIPKVYHGMGDIETPVRRVVPVLCRTCIAVNIVAIIIA